MSAPVLAVLATAAAAIALPRRLPLHRAAPATAAALLFLALLLRALLVIALSVLALLRLSQVRLIEAALSWCWHELLPDLPAALGFAEHPVAHAAAAAPLTLIGVSVAWLLARHLRAWRQLRLSLRYALGPGPRGTTVVAHDGVLLGTTRLGRGRILVSERALGELDAGELAAGITHELGHLRRRHRAVLAGSALLAALARPLPGTAATERALNFQLERDADQYAVRELSDPLALASAICKAATAHSEPAPLLNVVGSGSAVLRVRELLEGRTVRSRTAELLARATLLVLVGLIVVLCASVPAWADARPRDAVSHHGHTCSHRG